MENKETIEEVAERLFKEYSNYTSLAEGHYEYMIDKEDFKEASLEIAEWQQELGQKVGHSVQVERRFSDEELKNAFRIGFNIGYGSPVQELDLKNEHCERWFEQFKKK